MMTLSGRLSWVRVLVPIVIVSVVALLIGLTFYFGNVSPSPYYGPPYHWWFGFQFFGWFFFIPIFFLVFFGFRWFFWGPYGCGWYGRRYDPALDSLRDRFAKGEITREQFAQMRKDLE